MYKRQQKGYRFPEEEDSGFETEEILSDMLNMQVPPQGEVLDKDGNQVYSSVWYMENEIYGSLKTVSGKSMMELANESEKWNGRLYEMFSSISSAANVLGDYYSTYLESVSYTHLCSWLIVKKEE